MTSGVQMAIRNTSTGAANSEPKRGMVLPFEPLSLSFSQVNYYVDMPAVRFSFFVSEHLSPFSEHILYLYQLLT